MTYPDAGAVDQDVDPAMVLGHGRKSALERRFVSDVGGMGRHRGAGTADRLRRPFGSSGVAVEDRHRRPGAGQRHRRGASDAARTASDDRHLPV